MNWSVAYAATNTREEIIGLLEQGPTADSIKSLGRRKANHEAYQEAYKVAKDSNDVVAAAALSNLIGRNFEKTNEFQKALIFFNEGLQILSHRQVKELPPLEVGRGAFKGYVRNTEARYSRDLCHTEMPFLTELFGLPDSKAEMILSLGLRVNAGNMYLKQNQILLAQKMYQEALNSARELSSNLAMQQIYTNAVWTAFAENKLSEARKMLASALVDQAGVSLYELRKAFFVAGVVSREQGYIQQAIEGLEQARILYEQAQDDKGTAKVLAHLATAYAQAQNFLKAVQVYQLAIDLNEDIKDGEVSWHAYGGIAKAYTDLKRYQEALRYYEFYWQIVQKVGEQFTTDQGESVILKDIEGLFRSMSQWQ
jgi:tetratricopeptide (TPR) repeat protein